MRAIDSARSAGAHYADVRLTHIRLRRYDVELHELEQLGVGVRALVNGYWGFASGPRWTPEAVAWLGQEAVVQARANAANPLRRIDFGTIPVVTNGDWRTPIRIDPFETPVEELTDWFAGMSAYIQRFLPTDPKNQWGAGCLVEMEQKQQVFASTEGSFYTQTLNRTSPQASIEVNMRELVREAPMWPSAAGGLEVAYDTGAAVRAWAPPTVAELQAILALPVEPVDVGRYDVVFDAVGMGDVLAHSIGDATQLDRALGYEANAGGTSFLGPDPSAVLDKPLAAPSITITANRSHPGDLATVQWDAEGVVPRDLTLVDRGTFVNYQTMREQAAWLAPWYKQHGIAVRSAGYANVDSALEFPMQHTPNLVLHPGTGTTQLDDLVGALDKGVVFRNAKFDMDFQQSGGVGRSRECIKVTKGKAVARMRSAGILFRTKELWTNVAALGGADSQIACEARSTKGDPAQTTLFTVHGVPATIKEMPLVDITRKI
jgi:TldD protein